MSAIEQLQALVNRQAERRHGKRRPLWPAETVGGSRARKIEELVFIRDDTPRYDPLAPFDLGWGFRAFERSHISYLPEHQLGPQWPQALCMYHVWEIRQERPKPDRVYGVGGKPPSHSYQDVFDLIRQVLHAEFIATFMVSGLIFQWLRDHKAMVGESDVIAMRAVPIVQPVVLKRFSGDVEVPYTKRWLVSAMDNFGV